MEETHAGTGSCIYIAPIYNNSCFEKGTERGIFNDQIFMNKYLVMLRRKNSCSTGRHLQQPQDTRRTDIYYEQLELRGKSREEYSDQGQNRNYGRKRQN